MKENVLQNNIEKLLTKYIKEYVRCDNCKKMDTYLDVDKKMRITNKFCNNCKSFRY